MQGIYKITNKLNHKCYVGQSVDIKKRWREHRFYGTNEKTDRSNYHLYHSMRTYGIKNFKFTILEEVLDRNKLTKREIYWYEQLKPEYNQEYPTSVEYNNKGKEIYQINKDTLEIVDLFFNAEEAGRKCGISGSNIRKVAVKKASSAGGYYWCYVNDYSEEWEPLPLKPHVTPSGQAPKRVEQIDPLTGEVIQVFESGKEAAAITGTLASTISSVCNGKDKKTAGGFKWRFAEMKG